ncbi:POTRA domain-containing protein [Altibacter sp. HG106]|uniref:POTRA domain-containing protein n=1 Tax=Altibacter sp. HG106 TaxID=3023937 RepID=UPI00235102F6|nr:POTRA domain-containing protein [Altibacter sp. HG106]MDC7995987.1 hypothetical protein [Altibacter sp. HG106]
MKTLCETLVLQIKDHTLKRFLLLFLYLNIYTHASLWAQEARLTLQVSAEQPIPASLQDSLLPSSTFLNYRSLQRQVDTIPTLLQRMGFVDARLQVLQKKNDSLYMAQYHFGKKYAFIEIDYKNTPFRKKQIPSWSNQTSDSTFTIPMYRVSETLNTLTSLLTQQGDPFASLQLSSLQKRENRITATLTTSVQSSRTIDSIAIKGYEKFPRSYLTHYAGVRTGRIFNRKTLIRKNDLLDALGFARSIKPPEALFRSDSTTVYLYLEKENNNLFDGILGFATDEETNKLIFNGYLNLELNNNLNFGEQLLINYKADGNEQQNFRARTTLPYLLGSPFGVAGELKIFKRDSTFSTTEQLAQVSYQVTPTTSTYIGYKGYVSSNLQEEALVDITVEDYKGRYAIGGLAYTQRQPNPLFPQKSAINLEGEWGTRERDTLTENQFRIRSIAHYIINLNRENSFFIQNTTALLDSDSFLTNELFRFGGITSIRGFNENSIDASFYSVLNTEYRYQFNPGLYAHTIIDLAYFENDVIDLKQQLYSFGFGIGLSTQAGVFKLNIANGNLEGENFKFSNTKIHLSLSSRF